MFIDEVISILVAAGVGTFPGTIVGSSKGRIPPTGFVLTVTTTGGSGPEGTHNSTDKPAYVRPTVQVVAHEVSFIIAAGKAQAAYDALFPIRNTFIQGTWWRQVIMLQSMPGDIGLDDVGRAQLSFNAEVTKRPSAA